MRSINAATGVFFTPEEEAEGLALLQAVEDRVYTLHGSRAHRSNYGSLATVFSGEVGVLENSLQTSLEQDTRVKDLSFTRDGSTFRVLVNGQIGVSIGN